MSIEFQHADTRAPMSLPGHHRADTGPVAVHVIVPPELPSHCCDGSAETSCATVSVTPSTVTVAPRSILHPHVVVWSEAMV